MQTCRHESCKQRDRLQPSPATRLSWRCISAPIEDRVLPPVLSPECRSVNWSISLANSRASSGCRSEVGRMGEKKVEAQGNARNFRPDCKSPNQSAPPILTVHCKATSIKCNAVKAHCRKHQESVSVSAARIQNYWNGAQPEHCFLKVWKVVCVWYTDRYNRPPEVEHCRILEVEHAVVYITMHILSCTLTRLKKSSAGQNWSGAIVCDAHTPDKIYLKGLFTFFLFLVKSHILNSNGVWYSWFWSEKPIMFDFFPRDLGHSSY